MITPGGFRMGFLVFLIALLVQIPIMIAYAVGDRDKQHTIDYIIGFWAFASMRLSGYSPHVAGLENLPRGPAVYVVNHTSFLDILTLSGFIPRPLKYVSKDSILKIPLIGWPMKLAGHVPLGNSRRSQVATYRDTVASLSKGNSFVIFPEGGRSDDGRLQPFKKGAVKMALQAGLPLVPISIGGLAQWYPKGTLLPRYVPRGVEVIVHPTIELEGRSEDELHRMAFEAIDSGLPPYQRAVAQ